MACLSDNKSVMAVLNALGRCVDNQINLMTKNQIQDIRRLLLYLIWSDEPVHLHP